MSTLSQKFLYWANYNVNGTVYDKKIDSLETYESEVRAMYDLGRTMHDFLFSDDAADTRDDVDFDLHLQYFISVISTRVEKQIYDALPANLKKTPEFQVVNRRLSDEKRKWETLESEFTADNIIDKVNNKAASKKQAAASLSNSKTKMWASIAQPIVQPPIDMIAVQIARPLKA